MTEYPLVDLGNLTKPATLLIEKISNLVGGIFKPYQLKRVAKAEAEVEMIRAESRIRVTDCERRALYRFLEEEAKRQSNIEDITRKALPHLKEDSSPQNVEDDWITNFFEKCRIVSDDDMQKLWSRVLAGEANSPGAFSRKTVNLLADLDKNDAELFTRLCSFGWTIGNLIPLVYEIDHEVYNLHGINFRSLGDLESLGFVQFDALAGFQHMKLPNKVTVFYYGRPVELTFPKGAENRLHLGYVLLTRAGQELAPVCESKPVHGFFDFVYDRWASVLLVPKREAEQGAPADG